MQKDVIFEVLTLLNIIDGCGEGILWSVHRARLPLKNDFLESPRIDTSIILEDRVCLFVLFAEQVYYPVFFRGISITSAWLLTASLLCILSHCSYYFLLRRLK